MFSNFEKKNHKREKTKKKTKEKGVKKNSNAKHIYLRPVLNVQIRFPLKMFNICNKKKKVYFKEKKKQLK